MAYAVGTRELSIDKSYTCMRTSLNDVCLLSSSLFRLLIKIKFLTLRRRTRLPVKRNVDKKYCNIRRAASAQNIFVCFNGYLFIFFYFF